MMGTLDKFNPIVLREMRGRMRNRRTFAGLTGYAIMLSVIAGFIYAAFYYSTAASNQIYPNVTIPSLETGPYVGKTIFAMTVILLLVVLPFTAATLAADAIAGERERQTYDMLRITAMSTPRLVWGKLGAVCSLLVLYIVIPLPLLGLAFFFGGVSLGEILIAILAFLVTALAFAAWGLYISSLARTAKIATALASGAILLAVYVAPLLVWMVSIIVPLLFSNQSQPSDPLLGLVYLYLGGFLASLNPIGATILTGVAVAGGYGYFIFPIPVGTVNVWVISPWLIYVAFYLLLTFGLVSLTIRRLRKVSEV